MSKKELNEFLVDWVTRYKDTSERHALAENPQESADYLTAEICQLFEPKPDKGVSKEEMKTDCQGRNPRPHMRLNTFKPKPDEGLREEIAGILCAYGSHVCKENCDGCIHFNEEHNYCKKPEIDQVLAKTAQHEEARIREILDDLYQMLLVEDGVNFKAPIIKYLLALKAKIKE